MSKKLAIVGHPERGDEVIKLLEMMGGVAVKAKGFIESYCYYIEDTASKYIFWDYIGPEEIDKYEIFTLEEFLKKYPFKVGDKVIDDSGESGIIIEMKWDEEVIYKVDFGKECYYFASDFLRPYKETNMNENKFGTAKEPLETKSNAMKLVDGKVVDNLDEGKTMNKKLAIKGHPTRGKEVIELLKMMGGTNPFSNGMVIGNKATNCYYISENTATKYISWDYIGSEEINEYVIFTLEEFLEKYPFKVGDKVIDGYGNSLTIKSMSWASDYDTMVYDFKETEDVLCAEDLYKSNAEFLVNKEKSEEVGKMLCDMTLNHLHGNHLKNVLSELYEHIKTTSKEELEREFNEIESEGWTNVGPTVEEFITFCECVNKKPKYPTTYEKCCEKINACPIVIVSYDSDEDMLYNDEVDLTLLTLRKLLICRDAYWKIAGEKLGLGKPWEPDWCNEDKLKYCIECSYGTIDKTVEIVWNCILSFPTEEMRDAFYENFKDLIEQCKELL